MSRRATAKRSASPSPPKGAEGNNPSGFILKLFQMVNGAPDDVVSVSKFFVPSFSVCSFRNGYLYWTWEFCERRRQAAVHHITITNIHSVVVSWEESGRVRYQHIICQHPSQHQFFFVCAGTSPLATFRHAIVLCASAKHTQFPPQLFTYCEICLHFFWRRACAISTDVLRPVVPPSMEQIFGTFFLRYQDVHMATRIA